MPLNSENSLNCWLTVPSYGTHRVRCNRVEHGMKVEGRPESAKSYRVWYPVRATRGGVALSLYFPNYSLYNAFQEWMERYGRRLSATNNQVGPMRIVIPSMSFDRTAIPVSGMEYGDSVGTTVHRCVIQFDSSGDAGDFTNLEISRFRQARRDRDHSQYFYPGGVQVGGPLGGKEDPLATGDWWDRDWFGWGGSPTGGGGGGGDSPFSWASSVESTLAEGEDI
jgi:hypothetical protein